MLTIHGNQIILQRPRSITVIEPYGPNCVRCRSTRSNTVHDENWTLLDPLPAHYTITSDEKSTALVNGDISVLVENNGIRFPGRVTFYRKGEKSFVSSTKAMRKPPSFTPKAIITAPPSSLRQTLTSISTVWARSSRIGSTARAALTS